MNAAPHAHFWDWSLSRYDRAHVERELLELQDRFDFNVNLLLWCCWCAAHYDEIPEAALRRAHETTAQWSPEVTAPLRAARRYLKSPPPLLKTPQSDALRAAIKSAELDAERIEQGLLEEVAEIHLQPAPAGSEAGARARARRNITLYAQLAGAVKRPGFTTALLESVIGHIFADGASAQNEGRGQA